MIEAETDLNVGDKIKDNDPRMGVRTLTVVEVLPKHVMAKTQFGLRPFRIQKARIFADDKPRRTGFSLFKDHP